MAQHALVLGSSRYVQSNPTEPAQSAQPVDTTLLSDPSQKSDKSKSPCMAPRATATKEQGFSEAVAARIEAPQRGSTRSVYEAKWAIFTKWCITNQVDFMALQDFRFRQRKRYHDVTLSRQEGSTTRHLASALVLRTDLPVETQDVFF